MNAIAAMTSTLVNETFTHNRPARNPKRYCPKSQEPGPGGI
jgi:hypothetical protein